MLTTLKLLLIGSFFGLAAGISPGPVLTLVITETLKHNKYAGIKIAVSPLITDLPIILLTLFVFSRLSDVDHILSAISMAGGLYLLYLGYKTLKSQHFEPEMKNSTNNALRKGIMVNFLNPHPYLFWITVGTPYIIKAQSISMMALVLFLASFYALLIGSKIIVALLASHSKTFLNQKSFTWIMRFLGMALLVFAVLLFHESIKHFL